MRRPLVRAHQLTTAHLQAAYPFMAEQGLGGRGVLIGRDVNAGGSFCYDPWVLYEDGVITGPSAIIAGQVGLGKSALVKTYLAASWCSGDARSSSTLRASTSAWPPGSTRQPSSYDPTARCGSTPWTPASAAKAN